jgi:2-dehydropantoate 2-reductase
MRLSIVGAGAIGTVLAVRLALAGHTVSVLARGATLQAIRQQGLRLHDLQGDHCVHVQAAAEAAALGPQDVVFVSTKTTALADVLPALAPLLTPDTIVVPTINGVPWWYFQGIDNTAPRIAALDPDGVLARALPPSHLLGCVVYITAEALAPAVVRANNPHRLIIGEIGTHMEGRAERLAQILTGAGIATEATERIRDYVWAKVISNISSNPVSVLTGATLAALYTAPALQPMVRGILEESIALAGAYGAQLPFGPEGFIARGAQMGAVRTSMLQDVEAGRPLELAAIGDAVLELAARKGIAMPVTADVIAQVRARAAAVRTDEL